MRRVLRLVVALAVVLGLAFRAWAAENTLEKISRTSVFMVVTRTASPPFDYINKQNEWVGFSIDLARLVHKGLEKKLNKTIKFELKESAPATRIPLLSSMAVEMISGTMTDTRARRDSVDFSLTFFVTGAQFLVKEGSPIRGIQDLAGKRVGAQQGSTNERAIRERVPQAQLVVFPDQPAGFTALVQGRVDTYTNDGIQLWGLKYKAPNPNEWKVVGEFYTNEPYGMAMRKNDSDFRAVVNNALMEALEDGEYFKIYEKWFGPKSETPYPMTDSAKAFLMMQVVPKQSTYQNHPGGGWTSPRMDEFLIMPLFGSLGMQYDFQWSVLWTAGQGEWLLQGIWTTLRLSAISWIVACALGILSGTLRPVPFAPLRLLATCYVEFFRNVPLLVWLFFWYFGVPQALPRAAQDWLNFHGPEFWCAVAGLSVYHGARMSEVIRAGIQSIPKTLLEASIATGLSVAQAYRLIIIPIALRLIVPPVTNESLNLLKNSSLAMTIGVAELTLMARQVETYTAKAFEALTAGALIYLVLCLSIALIMTRMEHRFRIPGLIVRAGRAEH